MKFTTASGQDVDVRAMAFDELEALLATELDADDRAVLEAERSRRLTVNYAPRRGRRQAVQA